MAGDCFASLAMTTGFRTNKESSMQSCRKCLNSASLWRFAQPCDTLPPHNGPNPWPNRGLMSVNLEQWISDHKIDEVECIVPDINGVQRGKVLPAKKFLSSVKDKSLRIPGSVFICTIDGH